MSRTTARSLALLAAVSACTAAADEERYDHRGSVGLVVAAGGDWHDANIAGVQEDGPRGAIDLGASAALTDRTELIALGRISISRAPRLSASAGIRSGYQLGRWMTFFDIGLSAHFGSLWSLGPRAAVGVQYEVLPVLGLFTSIEGQLGWSNPGLRILAAAVVGLQFRSYLLE